MIEGAWDEYRGWAKRARTLQTNASHWSSLAFVCTALAAVLGAAAAQTTAIPWLGKALAFASAVVAAITPVVGREILSADSETKWIRARATAEAIKSECFRFAAKLGDYAGATAESAFLTRRDALSEPAVRAGLTPEPDPALAEGDARRPQVPLTAAWYIQHRIDEQIKYYAKGQTDNERSAAQLRTLSFASAIIAAILGVAESNFGLGRFAPWIGVMTTVTVALMAYGLLDRRQYLAVTYGAMVMRLSRIKEMSADPAVDIATLVTTTENLLQGEHAAWSQQMVKPAATPTKT